RPWPGERLSGRKPGRGLFPSAGQGAWRLPEETMHPFPRRTDRFMRPRLCLAILVALFAAACTAPRSVMLSPEATPKGKFRAGAEVGVNLPTQTADALYGGLESSAKTLWNRSRNDTAAITADSLNDLAKALMA